MSRFKKHLPLILIFFLSYFSVRFLLKPGFFPTHDNTQIARVFEMKQALGSLQVPARWVADLGFGFGYPIFNFYNPLPYYFGGIINLLGVSSLTSTKLTFIFAIFVSGFSMYFLTKEFFGVFGGVVSALFYLYAPYHAVQIYVRGALAELWAYAFLPLIFFSLYKNYQSVKLKKDTKTHLLLASIVFAVLVLSHNLSVLIWLPPLLIFIILFSTSKTIKTKTKFLTSCFVTILLGAGLSCFFWLPALVEKGFTSVNFMVSQKFNPLEHFIFPDQLWFAFFGYGGSVPGRPDGLSFQLGKLHLIFVLFSIILFAREFFTKKRLNDKKKIILFFILLFFFSIFMMTEPSRPVWQTFFPSLSYLQFPWRFLSLAALASSFLAGSVFLYFKSKKKQTILILSSTVALLFFVNCRYFQPLFTGPAQDSDFLADEKIKWETSLASDEYLPEDFPRPESFNDLPKEKFTLQEEASLSIKIQKPHHYRLELETSKDNLLTANIAYFPGWQVAIDGKKTSIIKKEGLITLLIPQGIHQIDFYFKNTPLRTFANFISLISIVLLALFLILKTSIIKLKNEIQSRS